MPEQKWQFEQDGLIISASRTNGRGTVAWCGVSDSRTPGLFLRPVLRDLSEKMKGAEVTVDFTKLEYMNSATVSPLINFVKTLDGTCTRILVVFAADRLATNSPAVHARHRHDPAPRRRSRAPRASAPHARFRRPSPLPRQLLRARPLVEAAERVGAEGRALSLCGRRSPSRRDARGDSGRRWLVRRLLAAGRRLKPAPWNRAAPHPPSWARAKAATLSTGSRLRRSRALRAIG